MELVYILDSKSKFSRFESWLGYKFNWRVVIIGSQPVLKTGGRDERLVGSSPTPSANYGEIYQLVR